MEPSVVEGGVATEMSWQKGGGNDGIDEGTEGRYAKGESRRKKMEKVAKSASARRGIRRFQRKSRLLGAPARGSPCMEIAFKLTTPCLRSMRP